MTAKAYGTCLVCHQYEEYTACDAEEAQILLHNQHGTSEHHSFDGVVKIKEIPRETQKFTLPTAPPQGKKKPKIGR